MSASRAMRNRRRELESENLEACEPVPRVSPGPGPRLALVPPRAASNGHGAAATGGHDTMATLAPVWSEARERAGHYGALGEAIKEAGDRVLAAIGLVLIAPLLAVIAAAVRLDSPGPVLFRQQRVGRHRRPFTFWKFRGMFRDARERYPELYDYDYSATEIQTLRFHPEEDPRVTRVGRFIRRTSLDELPNLINVVLGDMSLVGPRPEIPELIPYYGSAANTVLSVKPGITSLAKLIGRDHFTFAETLAIDVEYVRTRSLIGDLRILIGTVVMVLTGRSAGR